MTHSNPANDYRGIGATPIISNPFEPTEMEKFFAHLNNGEVCLEPSSITYGYRIIISPKAGE